MGQQASAGEPFQVSRFKIIDELMGEYGLCLEDAILITDAQAVELLREAVDRKRLDQEILAELIVIKLGMALGGEMRPIYSRTKEGGEQVRPMSDEDLKKVESFMKKA